MNRRSIGGAKTALLGASALLLAAAFPSAALADPFAGTLERADVSWKVKPGKGAVHQLGVSVEYSLNAIGVVEAASLQVQVAKCKKGLCEQASSFVKDLEPAEFSLADDLSTARLATTFAGGPLEVDWSGGSSGDFSFTGGFPENNVTESTTANAAVTALGVSCSEAAGSLARTRMLHADRDHGSSGAEEPKSIPGLKKKLKCAAGL